MDVRTCHIVTWSTEPWKAGLMKSQEPYVSRHQGLTLYLYLQRFFSIRINSCQFRMSCSYQIDSELCYTLLLPCIGACTVIWTKFMWMQGAAFRQNLRCPTHCSESDITLQAPMNEWRLSQSELKISTCTIIKAYFSTSFDVRRYYILFQSFSIIPWHTFVKLVRFLSFFN